MAALRHLAVCASDARSTAMEINLPQAWANPDLGSRCD